MGWLEGSSVLVTGGGSGIGRGVVEVFLEEGAQVAVMDISRENLEELGRVHGGRVVLVQGDVTSLDDNLKAVEKTVRAFGKLDTLVCCVGLFDCYMSLLEIPGAKLADAFDEIFSVNVKSYLLSAKAALPELLKTEGSIIFTVSSSGFYTDGAGFLYGGTKWAVRGLVNHLAFELAPKVRVNGVAPGGTANTRLRGLKSLGQDISADQVPGRDERIRTSNPLQVLPYPRDHAWAYVYLASKERSRVVTGVVINTDGGRGVSGSSRLAGLVS